MPILCRANDRGRYRVGNYIRVEPLDWDAHGEGLARSVTGYGNDQLWDYIPIGPFNDLPAFRKAMESTISARQWQLMVLVRSSDAKPVGMASYMRIRESHGSAEVGCVVFGDDLKRTREATEAMYLMADHLFDGLGYRRYEWKCDNENDASKSAAERYGFVFEGVFRNDLIVKGKNRDTAWFSMIGYEWPAIRAGFRVWLSDDNFDENGQQNRSLVECRC